jgi:hypothetical protein
MSGTFSERGVYAASAFLASSASGIAGGLRVDTLTRAPLVVASAALCRIADLQSANHVSLRTLRIGWRSAECNSAIRQNAILRYVGGTLQFMEREHLQNVDVSWGHEPERCKSAAALVRRACSRVPCLAQPRWGCEGNERPPRVVASLQPSALGRNPVGIRVCSLATLRIRSRASWAYSKRFAPSLARRKRSRFMESLRDFKIAPWSHELGVIWSSGLSRWSAGSGGGGKGGIV